MTSSFHYFPGVPIFHSTDLINWEQIGYCLTRKSQLPLEGESNGGGIFAPTLRYHDGIFYMVTTNVMNGKNFYVYTEDPRGPWSDPIYIEEWPGIDPSFLFDDDGKVYITGNSSIDEEIGIYQAELDISTVKLLSDRVLIWSGTGGSHPEAPHLYKINDLYYLMIAEGGTEYGHMVTIARSKDPYGPFKPYKDNPILTHRSTNKSIQAVGHADLVEFHDGTWWAVFLGIRPIGYPAKHHLGRETFLAPVKWSEDNWPIIGDQGTVHEVMESPDNGTQEGEKTFECDHFDSEELGLQWNFLRNPHLENYSLTEKKSHLALACSQVTLDELDSPSFIGQRQRHFDCDVSTLLRFTPKNEDDEAGITVYMNERYHYEIFLTMTSGNKQVCLRKRIGDISKVVSQFHYPYEEIILGIRADCETYQFYVDLSPTHKERNRIYIGHGECGLLSKEVAGGFTGVFFGLYATGRGKEPVNKAYFDWFIYEILS